MVPSISRNRVGQGLKIIENRLEIEVFSSMPWSDPISKTRRPHHISPLPRSLEVRMVIGDHPRKLWSIVGSLPGHPNRENPIFPAYARPVAILQPYPLDTNIWNRPRTHCEAYPGQRGRAPCNHAPEGERCHRLRAHRRQPAPLHLIITASSQPGRRSSWVPHSDLQSIVRCATVSPRHWRQPHSPITSSSGLDAHGHADVATPPAKNAAV